MPLLVADLVSLSSMTKTKQYFVQQQSKQVKRYCFIDIEDQIDFDV